ncbi:cePP protein isoform 2 [Zea mays]|uniref:AAR2 protein family n=1 Tax=Zea mays TaxID=4577 RepID=A0A804MIQ6_MAIZE|nr:cePP protein isoform 2 [Zea mays]|eukprot:XP_023157291.1 cePP protein isoform X2 [Zea mays]
MASGGGAAARMDPEVATELVRKGATLLLLDVPQRTLFGIDTQMFSVGPKFKGMKMVPPGAHFVYYCSPNRHGNEFAPTVGFFLTTHQSEVIVRKWDVQEERLIKLSEEEDIRYSEAVRHFEFDDQLGPYNLDSYGDWKQLSDYLSPNVIERLEPIGGEITIAWESSWMDKAPQSDMERRLVEQLREGKFAKNAPVQSGRRGCYYTSIPASTSLLETILAKNYEGQEDLFLGELQFAFIAFMMGQSLEAFMQWKALVSLLLSCSDAPLHTRTNMFIKFIRTLYYQLKHGFQHTQDSKSGDMGNSLCLDETWFSRDIFLYRLSKDFFTVVFEAPVVDGDLLSWARKLKSLLETTFGWDLEDDAVNLIDEDDEFAPVVVEMDGS